MQARITGTQTKEDTMAKSMELEEKVLRAENVPEPQLEIEGSIEGAEYVTPAPVLSAGQAYVYDTLTFERSLCRKNNLRHLLKLTRPDGSHVFTTVKPTQLPKRGTLKCMLHPDERADIYDTWGFPTCRKSNLTSPFQVRRHMQKRHKQEYEAIKEEEARVEKERERQLREALLNKEPPLYVKGE